MTQANDHNKSKKSTRYKQPLFLVAIFMCFFTVSLLFYGVYKAFYPDNSSTQLKGTALDEARYKDIDNKELAEKNYQGYQTSLLVYYDSYFRTKEYDSAETVLNKILKNVPKKSLNSSTYFSLSQIYKAKGDKNKYEAYTKLLIKKLEQEGRTEDAAFYKKQIEGSR